MKKREWSARGRRRALPFTLALSSALAVSVACGGNDSNSPGSDAFGPDAGADGSAALPFTPVAPATYVAKVKNILVGLPPTDAEVNAVIADPSKLISLVDAWMQLPQYDAKMMSFFEQAFQQGQISIVDFAVQASPRLAGLNDFTAPLAVQNASESFARTVIAMNHAGHPFTDTFTATSFMMTPALMELYAFLDSHQVDDDGTVTDQFRVDHPNTTVTVSALSGPIPIEQTLDPTSPNYMHWYNPDVGPPIPTATCRMDPIVYPNADSIVLHYMITGSLNIYNNEMCREFKGTSAASAQLTNADYTTWKMVTIRQPNPGETPTAFYDLPTLRTTNELVLKTPRVGFFTTPAFFANWKTNASNQMRGTVNQALIVALGAQVDGTDTTTPATTPGSDPMHIQPGSTCFGCHQLLDPTRSILAANYSWYGHRQYDATYTTQKGQFAFEGVIKKVNTLADFGTALAFHPLFSSAWVQKLNFYINSRPAELTDPEFQRVMNVFVKSGYSWNALVRELAASPLTTGATSTLTVAKDGEVVSIMRANHFCASMSFRLGINDVCGLDATSASAAGTTVPQIVSGLPTDGYGRGSVTPVLPNASTLFFRAGIENICRNVADLVIDSATPTLGAKNWSGASPDAAITDFVTTVMALPPGDPRNAKATSILHDHYTNAVGTGASATDALKSTFVAACLAPSAVSVGL